MQTKVIEKQPGEDIVIGVDCDRWLKDGDTISAIISTYVFDSDNTDVSDDMLVGTSTFSGTVISTEIKDGVDQNRYKIVIKFQTATHPVLEIDIPLLVKET